MARLTVATIYSTLLPTLPSLSRCGVGVHGVYHLCARLVSATSYFRWCSKSSCGIATLQRALACVASEVITAAK